MRDIWMRIIPGVRKAAKTFHRGQAPEKRAMRMPEALKRFEMLPATSMRIMWKGRPRPRAPQRRVPVAHLLEAHAEAPAHDVDVVALALRGLEERRRTA
jgi:hypothetical protein